MAGCGRACPWNCYQPNPLSGGLGTPVGAPPPASGSSDVPGPRRPVKTKAELVGRERQVKTAGWGARGNMGQQEGQDVGCMD